MAEFSRALPPLLLLPSLAWAQQTIVTRPTVGAEQTISFEGITESCDFALGAPVSNEYAVKSIHFAGPGFGALNGGVPLHKCALWSNDFPPLGNHSVHDMGFLGFSTLHSFQSTTGKPISPETIRFEVRVTNIKLWLAGIDGHAATIELWSGPDLSFDDQGELLQTFSFTMSDTLTQVKLVDAANLYIDCVKRIEIYSAAKVFVMDDLQYGFTAADDSLCGAEPGKTAPSAPPGSDSAASARSSSSTSAATLWAFAAAASSWLLVGRSRL